MRYFTTKSIHKAGLWLIYLVAFTLAADVGYADDFRENRGGGSDRGGRRYDGHRDQNRPSRGSDRGGRRYDGHRDQNRPSRGSDRGGRRYDGHRDQNRPSRGSDRGDRRYDGHRDQNRQRRSAESIGGRPNDGKRDQNRSYRGGEYRDGRGRPGIPHGRALRHEGRDYRYKNRWDGHRNPWRGYHAPRYGRYPTYPYRRPYYWRHAPGYFSVRPGIGSLFLTLPLGCAGIYLGGSIYYYYDDVYYRPVSSGYVVVAPPAVPVPQLASGQAEYSQVSVTVELLNVRSGPGAEYEVFRQVRRGEILDVEEDSDGWLYVTLPGGEKGWIEAQYAAPMVYSDE